MTIQNEFKSFFNSLLKKNNTEKLNLQTIDKLCNQDQEVQNEQDEQGEFEEFETEGTKTKNEQDEQSDFEDQDELTPSCTQVLNIQKTQNEQDEQSNFEKEEVENEEDDFKEEEAENEQFEELEKQNNISLHRDSNNKNQKKFNNQNLNDNEYIENDNNVFQKLNFNNSNYDANNIINAHSDNFNTIGAINTNNSNDNDVYCQSSLADIYLDKSNHTHNNEHDNEINFNQLQKKTTQNVNNNTSETLNYQSNNFKNNLTKNNNMQNRPFPIMQKSHDSNKNTNNNIKKTIGGFFIKSIDINIGQDVNILSPRFIEQDNYLSYELSKEVSYINCKAREYITAQSMQTIGLASTSANVNAAILTEEKTIKSIPFYITTKYYNSIDAELQQKIVSQLEKKLKYDFEERLITGIQSNHSNDKMPGILEALANKDQEIIKILKKQLEDNNISSNQELKRKLEEQLKSCKENGKCIMTIKKSELSIKKLATIIQIHQLHKGKIVMHGDVLDYLINNSNSKDSEQDQSIISQKSAINNLGFIVNNVISNGEIENLTEYKTNHVAKKYSYLLIGDLSVCNVFIFGEPEIGTQRELINDKREYTIWQKTQVNLELDIAPFFEVKPKLIALIIEEDEDDSEEITEENKSKTNKKGK